MPYKMTSTMPEISPTPSTLDDYTGREKEMIIVAGYHGMLPARENQDSCRRPNNKRHIWSIYCFKCLRYFTLDHKETKRRFKDGNSFKCPQCHGNEIKRIYGERGY